MKSPEVVFQELLDDVIVFNVGLRISDRFDRASFTKLMRDFMRRTEIFDSIKIGGEKEHPMPETTWEDIVEAKRSFVAGMAKQGRSPEEAACVLKKVFEPVFAARFEDHREIMSFLYRLTQDAELLDRLLRA